MFFILFKFANSHAVLEQIYPEVSGLLTGDKFIEIFNIQQDIKTIAQL